MPTSPCKAGPCSEASVQEFVREVTAQLWHSNALMVVNAFLVIIMVAVGAAGSQSHRHAAMTHFLFLGASSLYLPVVSYVASSIGKESCSCSTSGLDMFCHGRSYVALLLIWTVLVQIIGTNTTAIIAADDYHGGQQQNLGPSMVLLARMGWTSYLVFYYTGRGFLTMISKYYTMGGILFYKKLSRYVIGLCLLSLAKIMLKLYAFWKARKSYALGRNPQLIAGYMEKLQQGDHHSDRRPQEGSVGYGYAPSSIPPLIVMGEDKQKIEETPHGYSLKQGNSSLVTVDMVWRMASTGHDVLLASHPWLKEICLSFALYKLLTRRFSKTHLAECGSAKAFSFVLDVLLNNGNADRVFSVIADEISFVHDSYYSSIPTSYFGRLLLTLNMALSLSIINWCLAGGALILQKFSHRSNHQIYCKPEPDAVLCLFSHLQERDGDFVMEFGNILFNTIPTLTLFGAVVFAEAWEIVFYLCSNWVKVTVLCNYMTHESWQKSPCVQTLLGFLMKMRRIKFCSRRSWSDRMGQRSLLLGLAAHEQQPSRLFFCSSDPKMQYANVPPQVAAAIVNTLRSSNGTLSKGTAVLHKSRIGSHLLWACEGLGTSDVILTWHIATDILESEPRHGGAGASSTSSRRSADKSAVATHLSRYCAYLVADVPELLPDDKAWSSKLYKTLSSDIKSALAGDSGEHGGVVAARLAERSEHQVVKAGVRLGRQLMELIPDEEARWALLESFWCEILLYAAPSDNLKAHKKAIAHGTELVTLIWALLTHAGIVTRPN